jgi:hypothetical protein
MHYNILDNIKDIEKYKSMGIKHYRIELFDENKEQVQLLINKFYDNN